VRIDLLLAEACDLFLPLAQDAGLMLNQSLENPVVVAGNQPRLQRLFSNLLDNAIKYTPSGGSVSVALRAEGEAAVVRVRDTGCGINARDMPRIFDRFYRAESQQNSPGNGLGLALARAIATAHGGTIGVESAPGKGSMFIVQIPLAPGEMINK
jgi:signal transduction histidine kinase